MNTFHVTDGKKRRQIEEMFMPWANKSNVNIIIKIRFGERKNQRNLKDRSFVSYATTVLTNPNIDLGYLQKGYNTFPIWGKEGSYFYISPAELFNINFTDIGNNATDDIEKMRYIYVTTVLMGNKVDLMIKIERE